MADGIISKDELLLLTLRQLRQEASKLSVPLYSRKTKAVLVELIITYQNKSLEAQVHLEENNEEEKVKSAPEPSIKISESKTTLAFLPRDPDWAYVFWHISDQDRDKAQSLGANKLCLRLYDVTGSEDGNINQGTLREIAVDSFSTEWYLPIPVSDRTYKVELGYRYGFEWMTLSFSSPSHVPSSHPSEQILDKFVPFNLESTTETNSEILNSQKNEGTGLHERLYQAATNYPKRIRVGSEEFMEDISSTDMNSLQSDSGAGIWASGSNDSGSGIINNRPFWLVADSELIVYGSTDPSATLTIGGEKVPLASDGTFRLQVPFRDGSQKYNIKVVDASGTLERSITMNFDRTTPLDNTKHKDNSESEWFE